MNLSKTTRVQGLAFACAAMAFACGCAGFRDDHASGMQVPADLAYHRSLKIEEYVRPFGQEPYAMPESAQAVMQIIPFADVQPAGENKTLVMVTVRIRDARPDDAKGDSACVKDAVLLVKPAPGFALLHLYGAEEADTGTGIRQIRLGELRPAERRVFIAEMEATQEAGKQRILGATFRCARVSDGYLFETLEGISLQWQNQNSQPKVNEWAARNSLILSDAEALIRIGRLVEHGEEADLSQALVLADLQLNSIELLIDLDKQGLGRERARFIQVRKRLAGKVKAKGGEPAVARSKVARAGLPGQGIALASQAPVGPWTTLARLLTIPPQ